jgi:hypothetical protein
MNAPGYRSLLLSQTSLLAKLGLLLRCAHI